VHDIEDVIRWMKDPTGGWRDETDLEDWEPAESNFEHWDGENIYVVGASAGGNLAAAAAANAYSDDEIKPAAVAILSGFPETGQTSTGAWSCDAGSSDAEDCWESLNNYLGCLNAEGKPPRHLLAACQTNGKYNNAAPINQTWDADLTPPMFIANAGYGDNTDLSPLQLALDFHSTLDAAEGYESGANLRLCQVESSGHATGYLDKWEPNRRSCEGTDEQLELEVIESIVNFFQANPEQP
jgi:hypothetical protein